MPHEPHQPGERYTPSPAVRLARAIAVADGPEAGLMLLPTEFENAMPGSHRPASIRADLLRRAGRPDEARVAYEQAIALCRNEIELAHLLERLGSL